MVCTAKQQIEKIVPYWTGKFPILVVAHRGFSGAAPENTLIAFRKGIEIGSDMIELDVHLSRDGEIVVIHDETLERTTNGKGMNRRSHPPGAEKARCGVLLRAAIRRRKNSDSERSPRSGQRTGTRKHRDQKPDPWEILHRGTDGKGPPRSQPGGNDGPGDLFFLQSRRSGMDRTEGTESLGRHSFSTAPGISCGIFREARNMRF